MKRDPEKRNEKKRGPIGRAVFFLQRGVPCLFLVPVLLLTGCAAAPAAPAGELTGAAETEDQPAPETEPAVVIEHPEVIRVKACRYVANLTGVGLTDRWDVYGTDLGVPVYSPSQQRMYFLFGDTSGVSEIDPTKKKNWRTTVAGYTELLDFSEGIRWDGFLDDGTGMARELVKALHQTGSNTKEISKICQGGIELDGKLYFFYESIRRWGESGYWDVNYGGVIRSDDGGKTFEKVYDLSWIEPTDENDVLLATRLIQADINLGSVAVDFDGPSHVVPGFGQLYPLDGKDGYVYLFGRFGGRQKGIKVARVKREDFERFSAYEYLVRYENGEPVWLPYREGIDAITADPTAADVIPAPTSNMAVHWNEYLGKWVLTYYRTKSGICYATADHPYGPYSRPYLLISIKEPKLTADLPSKSGASGLYGGFTHEMMNREYGKIMPVVISQWYITSAGPRFYGSKMFEIEFE